VRQTQPSAHVASPCERDKAVLQPFTTHIPLPGYHFLTANQLPFFAPHFLLTCYMGDQSRPTHFRALFESALQAYETDTGVTLAEHPLAVQLQNCHDVESVTRVFSDFRGNGKIVKSVDSIVSILSTLSANPAFGVSIGLVRQKALMGCSRSLTVFCRHSRPPMQYTPASLSCLLYVPFLILINVSL